MRRAPLHRVLLYTVACLLVAVSLLLLALTVFTTLAVDGPQPPRQAVTLAPEQMLAGSATSARRGMRVVLNAQGKALIALARILDADVYRALKLELWPAIEGLQLGLLWSAGGDPSVRYQVLLDGAPGRDAWLYPGAHPQWRGSVSRVHLYLSGPPGAGITLRPAVGLLPASPATFLGVLRHDWLRLLRWDHSSINVHNHAVAGGTFIRPVVAAVLLVLLSLLAAALALRLFASQLPLLQVTLAVVLAAWLLLDALWVRQLAFRVQDTLTTFVAKSPREKLAAGPDSELYAFSEQVLAVIAADPAARVFVSSARDFPGMRSAYYLYPQNVYWEQNAELPAPAFFRTGDYILLLRPTKVTVASAGRRLHLPGQGTVTVRPLLAGTPGALFQVR